MKAVIDEALRCRERNEEKVILFLLCGHGFFDMKAYEDYLAGRLQAYSHPREEIMKSIGRLKALYPWIDQLPY